MRPVDSYEMVLEYLNNGPLESVPQWMCGLLFAPPNTPIGKSIMNRLDDWHHRSGKNFTFFCVGYLEHDEFNEGQPVGKLTELDGSGVREFYYSARAFEDIRRNVEAQSGWKYSGEADLLLANAIIRDPKGAPSLALEDILALDIDKLVNEGVYASAARLMERVCRAADESMLKGQSIAIEAFSDKEFTRTLLKKTLGSVVRHLKLDAALAARHFIVGAHHLEPA